jgi:GNAT superfamily N-acetyltransferase
MPPATSIATRIECHEVDQDRWPDLVRLFEGRGGPHNCWCLVWRESSAARAAMDLATRREVMASRVRTGTPVGLLAYLDGEPVAWCSVAPRETVRPLGGAPHNPEVKVWSLVCFYVQRRYRRQGISAVLLRAAITAAGAHGANILEATPVDPDSPSFRFMGFRPLFFAAGFQEVGTAGKRRHVMEIALLPRA